MGKRPVAWKVRRGSRLTRRGTLLGTVRSAVCSGVRAGIVRGPKTMRSSEPGARALVAIAS